MAAAQIGDDLLFLAYFLDSSGAFVTGLADVTFTAYRDGVVVVSAQPATPMGGGYGYLLPGASVTLAGNYWAEATTADVTVAQPVIPSGTWEVGGWVEDIDAPISGIASISAADVWSYTPRTVTGITPLALLMPLSPVTGNLSLVRGDSYLAADGREISWEDPGNWPDLTGATVTFKIQPQNASRAIFSAAAAVDLGPPQVITMEFTAAQTALLTSLKAPQVVDLLYEISTVLADDSVITLVTGHVIVQADLR